MKTNDGLLIFCIQKYRSISEMCIRDSANAEDNIERAIRSASAVLETVQEFVPEADLFYRVTHAVDSLKNYFRCV